MLKENTTSRQKKNGKKNKLKRSYEATRSRRAKSFQFHFLWIHNLKKKGAIVVVRFVMLENPKYKTGMFKKNKKDEHNER